MAEFDLSFSIHGMCECLPKGLLDNEEVDRTFLHAKPEWCQYGSFIMFFMETIYRAYEASDFFISQAPKILRRVFNGNSVKNWI